MTSRKLMKRQRLAFALLGVIVVVAGLATANWSAVALGAVGVLIFTLLMIGKD